MAMDSKGNIYYIIEKNGQSTIKMIRPQFYEIKDHMSIFEIKSNTCLGFEIDVAKDFFYFITDQRKVCKLYMMNDSYRLQQEDIFQIKAKEVINFKV